MTEPPTELAAPQLICWRGVATDQPTACCGTRPGSGTQWNTDRASFLLADIVDTALVTSAEAWLDLVVPQNQAMR